MDAWAKHKELKRKVNEAEDIRKNDRSSYSWYELKTLELHYRREWICFVVGFILGLIIF